MALPPRPYRSVDQPLVPCLAATFGPGESLAQSLAQSLHLAVLGHRGGGPCAAYGARAHISRRGGGGGGGKGGEGASGHQAEREQAQAFLLLLHRRSHHSRRRQERGGRRANGGGTLPCRGRGGGGGGAAALGTRRATRSRATGEAPHRAPSHRTPSHRAHPRTIQPRTVHPRTLAPSRPHPCPHRMCWCARCAQCSTRAAARGRRGAAARWRVSSACSRGAPPPPSMSSRGRCHGA